LGENKLTINRVLLNTNTALWLHNSAA